MSRVTTPSKLAAAAPTTNAQQIPQDKIAKLAYEKWCKRGRPHGTTMQDWLEAEKELKSECMKGGKK